jgi:hypothetical protein
VKCTGSVGIGGANAECTATGTASGALAINWGGGSLDYSGVAARERQREV